MPKVKVGNNNHDGVAEPDDVRRPRRRRQPELRLRGRPVHRHRRRRRSVRPGRQRLRAARPALPGALRRPQHLRATRTTCAARSCGSIRCANAAGAAGVGTTYSVPRGNMFAPGTASTKPEIFAMGFRNPFTVQADPKTPGTVVVGDYGPDAGTNSATRGPAGIIEWYRVTKPGFHGWPLCTGDNSAANSYFRYTFPSGPSGARFDCSAAQIPNESPNNTGLSNIPGPAVAGRRVAQAHGRPSRSLRDPDPLGPQESITGPIYDVRRVEPVDDEVAGVLRRRVVHARPRVRTGGARRASRTTAPGSCASTASSARASSATPSHTYPIAGPSSGPTARCTWRRGATTAAARSCPRASRAG